MPIRKIGLQRSMIRQRVSYDRRLQRRTSTPFLSITNHLFPGIVSSRTILCEATVKASVRHVSQIHFFLKKKTLRWLTYQTGLAPIFDGDIISIRFQLQCISGIVKTLQDVDKARLHYAVECKHFHCISSSAFLRLVLPTRERTEFHSSVYFHPNIRLDGWGKMTKIYLAKDTEYREVKEREKGEGGGWRGKHGKR